MTLSDPARCAVLELRQYSLRAGQRETLLALFEREFIESQEALGMTLFGQFRDLDDPDRFTWLRGFADMPARADALATFYDGPVWQAHRDAANATMLDSDNVLLLRPAAPESGFVAGGREGSVADSGLVVATLYYFSALVDDAFVRFFDDVVAPIASKAGAAILATLVTETIANNFPRLPVREGEHVFAWFARFESSDAHARHAAALASMPEWQAASAGLQRRIQRSETLRLAPTARSRTLHARAGH